MKFIEKSANVFTLNFLAGTAYKSFAAGMFPTEYPPHQPSSVGNITAATYASYNAIATGFCCVAHPQSPYSESRPIRPAARVKWRSN